MYNDFFGFRKQPFDVTPDPHVFYATPSYQRIYNNLVHSIREGKSLSVMIGEVGTGKTTMLRTIRGRKPSAATRISRTFANSSAIGPGLTAISRH